MPRQVKTEVKTQFNLGLVTEITGLQSPENSCEEADNCVFNFKGNVTRRYGLDFETDYSTKVYSRDGVVVQSFLWQNAAGLTNKDIVVLQIGGILYFYDTNLTAISKGASTKSVDFSLFATSDPLLCSTAECSFSFGQGYLFVCNPFSEPFYISYNSATDSFEATPITVRIRDVKGIYEGVDNDVRPTTLTDKHKYNLYNQGWAPTASVDYINTWRGSGSLIMTNAIGSARYDYPSNADVWWLFKIKNYMYGYSTVSDPFDRALPDIRSRGNSPAPKGHYIYNAFNIDRATTSGITGILGETSKNIRPRCNAFFSSRVWYSGTDAQGFSTKIYFSQIVDDIYKAGYCYQQNDPTNEDLFDLLATDGGVIEILEIGSVIKLFPLQTSLLVFATNGVWSISGNQGIGFTPNDFSVRKVSSIPALSSTSFVEVEGMPMWWNNDGIYTVTGMSAVGVAQIDSLTEKKIKSFYNKIPTNNKALARGFYNPLTRQIQWIYRSFAASNITEKYEFDKALVFNLTTGAFYPWTFPNNAVTVNGLLSLKTYGTTWETSPVVDNNGKTLLDVHGDPITTTGYETTLKASVFKYLVSYRSGTDYKITFAEEYDSGYHDFDSLDGTGSDYYSYFITNGNMDSEAQRKFQQNYIWVYAASNSQVKLQPLWNYAHSSTLGNTGSTQTLIYTDTKRDFSFKKVKIRGAGRILQLKFSSVTGQPFDLSGWSSFITQTSQP